MDRANAWLSTVIDTIDLVEIEEQRRPVPTHVPPPDAPRDSPAWRAWFLGPGHPYPERLPVRDYYRQRLALQIELVKLQNWVKESQRKVLVLMEGRDGAGKGSTIKRLMEHLNPRGARVVALEKPTDRERTQWYFQRYADHLPSGGEIVLFDRSWYNRAGVERVMGFCTPEQYEEFLRQVTELESMLVADGTDLFKVHLAIGREEQAARFEERRTNPLKQWKLSPIDVEALSRWDAYSEANDQALRRTDHPAGPWTIVKADDKLRARLETMRLVLHRLDYEGKDSAVARAPDPHLVAAASDLYASSPGTRP